MESQDSEQIFGTKEFRNSFQKYIKDETIDPAVERLFLSICNDFLEEVVEKSVDLADHRGADMVDARDLKLALASWDISLPDTKKSMIAEVHPQDLKNQDLIRKDIIASAKTNKKEHK
mmetsp:Transcript_17394/g.19822  ORF Transcript_17394/g.19822 Transcript_17394/m.19822 type:complete len:118 (+) Transcript_17394:36-389(+)